MSVITTDDGQYVSSHSLEHFVVILLECESLASRSVGHHPVDYVEFNLRRMPRQLAGEYFPWLFNSFLHAIIFKCHTQY